MLEDCEEPVIVRSAARGDPRITTTEWMDEHHLADGQSLSVKMIYAVINEKEGGQTYSYSMRWRRDCKSYGILVFGPEREPSERYFRRVVDSLSFLERVATEQQLEQ